MTICTDAFKQMALLERRALGTPDLALAIIEHPLVYRDADEIEQLADIVMASIEPRFRGEAL